MGLKRLSAAVAVAVAVANGVPRASPAGGGTGDCWVLNGDSISVSELSIKRLLWPKASRSAEDEAKGIGEADISAIPAGAIGGDDDGAWGPLPETVASGDGNSPDVLWECDCDCDCDG